MRANRSLMGPAAAALALFGIFATGLGLGQLADYLPGLAGLGSGGMSGVAAVSAPSEPVRLAIPTIGVRAPVRPVGLAENGSIAAPPLDRVHETGWYDRGPTPGQDGPAIIVGHVDGRTGPAVFERLHTLRPGDVVEVTRRDKRVAVFRVDSIEQFGKDNLPAAKVYGDFSQPVLRLITCGGRWVGGSTGYADNVLVFASLVDTRRA